MELHNLHGIQGHYNKKIYKKVKKEIITIFYILFNARNFLMGL